MIVSNDWSKKKHDAAKSIFSCESDLSAAGFSGQAITESVVALYNEY